MFQAGCGAPLGPGFGHAARQIALSPAGTASIHVRVTDQLVNTGNRDLRFLDVALPAKSAVDGGRFAVQVDGREPQTSMPEPGGPLRIAFDPPWQPKQGRTVVMDYDLQSNISSAGGAIATTANGFYVADISAFPEWVPPAGIFATSDFDARRKSIEVTAPADFRVLAGGPDRRIVLRTICQGAASVHQFSSKNSMFSQYAIGGRYQEQSVDMAHEKVIFWTFQPLDHQQAQAAAKRLAATAATYRQLFGRVTKGPWPIHIVETSASVLQPGATESGIVSASFPRGVLLDEGSFAQGIASEPVLERAEYELARTWFGWFFRASPESEILLGRGMSLYAVTRAAAARGGAAARNAAVARLLSGYDLARQRGEDGQLLQLPADASPDRQTTYAYRAALFFVALEDGAGRENFDRALRRVLHAVGEQPIDADELRSAVEATTERDFAGVFRSWLNRPGVPDDFRKRYTLDAEGRSAAASAASGNLETR
jgi:hypothetical protein